MKVEPGTLPPWKQFVHDFLRAIGARPKNWGHGLRVTLTRQQLQLVEGRPTGLLYWGLGPPPPEETTIYLAFVDDVPSPQVEAATDRASRDEEGEGHPRWELCVPHSFRGRQFIAAAQRLWPAGRLYLVPAHGKTGGWRWRPQLMFHFRLAYAADRGWQRIRPVTVDLVSGHVVPNPDLERATPTHPKVTKDEHPPSPGVAEDPALTVGHAYEQAREHLVAELIAEDDGWAADYLARHAREQERVRTYVRRAQLEENQDPVLQLENAQLAAFSHWRPRIDVDVAAVTVVYAPGPRRDSST